MTSPEHSPIYDIFNPPRFPYYQTYYLMALGRSPEDLKREFQHLGLVKEFIDWVANLGFKVELRYFDKKKGHYEYGRVDYASARIIAYYGDSIKFSVNSTIVHELVHLASPQTSSRENSFSIEYKEFEKAIDQIAEPYARNPNFMDYVRRKIPIIFANQLSLPNFWLSKVSGQSS